MIAFDTASNSEYQTGSSYSWLHTIGGQDRILIVGISMLSVAGSSVSSITANGQAMTKLRHDVSVSGTVRTELWYIVAPATGSITIAVTLSTALDSVAGGISLKGVDQVSPVDAENGGTGLGDPATINVTTVKNNCWVVDVIATADTAITVGAGQTQRHNISGALGSGAGSTEGPKTPAGAVTMSWTDITAGLTWTMSGMSVTPVAEVSSWMPNTNQPIESTNPVKRLQYLYPNLSWQPKIIINPTTLEGPRVTVMYPQRYQYQKLAKPITPPGQEAERITLDKWIGYHPDFAPGPKHWEYLYPSFSVDPTFYIERITLDKWYRELERPPKGPIHREFQYPSFFWYPKILLYLAAIAPIVPIIYFSQRYQYQKLAFCPLPLESPFSLPSKRLAQDWTETTKNTTDFSLSDKNTTAWGKIEKNITDWEDP